MSISSTACRSVAVALVLVTIAPLGLAAEPRELLTRHCASCHGKEKPKGGLVLDPAPVFERSEATGKAVLERLLDRTMPPAGKPQPTDSDRAALAAWLGETLKAAQAKRAVAEGRAMVRRLNRAEYNNTIRDLLGVDLDLAETLPEDGIAHGFDNVDVALDLSPTLFERYLAAADTALDAALPSGPRPKPFHVKVEPAILAREHREKYGRVMFGEWNLVRDDAVVVRHDPPAAPRLLIEPTVPARGRYRYRIAASADRDPERKVSLRVYAGTLRSGAGRTWLSGVYDLAEKPATIEFTERLEKGDTISMSASGVTRQWNLNRAWQGPGAAVHSVEVEGPVPPDGAADAGALLGGVDPAKGNATDAEAVLRRFAPRAFRRPVAEAELAPFAALVRSRLEAGYRFEDAIKVGMKAVLCSPAFLYLRSAPGRLNDFDLAARLSYFLWSTMPDAPLTALAAKGELGTPEALHRQVERMLLDPRSTAFAENFTGQWLDLRKLRATEPDKALYPEFDPLLEYSLPRETRLFFDAILREDRSLLEFAHSDWAMLNGRLAEHYRIPGVVGQSFRPVRLPPGSHRGGVLTQAAVLKVTANGTSTTPVVRGAWVLDRMLGAPVPPPPQNVPAVEPDIRGAVTIRAQLTRHRGDAGCAACHDRIDPPGFALESFDPIGGWRARYRVTGSKVYKPTGAYDGRAVAYAEGPAVDPSGALPDGTAFSGIDEFKAILLRVPDRIARNLTERLVVYATGHGIDLADREGVDRILAAVRARNYGFRTLVHDVVQSNLFLQK